MQADIACLRMLHECRAAVNKRFDAIARVDLQILGLSVNTIASCSKETLPHEVKLEVQSTSFAHDPSNRSDHV